MSTVLIVAGLAESLLNFRGDLIRAMQARGHTVHAVAPDCDIAFREQLDTAGIHFHPVIMQRSGLNPLADLTTFREIRAVCRAVKPDIVLAYTIKPVAYGLLAARSAGIRRRFALITGTGYTFAEAASLPRRLLGGIARLLYKLGLLGVSGVFFQNPDDRDMFIGYGLVGRETPIHMVNGSGVNLAHFAPAPLPEGASFLLVARLLLDKGIREYAAAARQVKRTHPQASFHLVGPTDPSPNAIPESELEGWMKEGVLTYHGVEKDVRPSIAAASVYVLPSYSEGTPRSVLEAMAMGRAVITTDAPGCRETVEEGVNGFLVPPRDSEALAAAMCKLADSAALRAFMGDTSRKRAEGKYDVHEVNRQMLAVLEGVGDIA